MNSRNGRASAPPNSESVDMSTLHLDRRAADLAQKVAEFPGDHLLKMNELAAWPAVSEVSVKRWHLAGIGPRATKVGLNAVRFRKDDVLAWLEKRAALAEA